MLAPSSSASFSVALKRRQHAGLDALGLARQLLGHAEADAVEALGASAASIAPGKPIEVESRVVVADHVAQQQRGVGDVARQRAGLVQRRGEGDHPVAADGAVRRLQADDPAQRGGLADRAAGVGAQRPRRRAGRDGGGAAAARAARHARAVPRVEHRPEGGVLVRRAHRELVLVGLAEQRRAGGGEPRDDRRRVRRAVALEDLRAGLARHALGAEEVLDGERDAGQRRAAARRARARPRRPTGRR